MNMQQIRTIANKHGIKTSKIKKLDLVRDIQKGEGNIPCYATATSGECDQQTCLWRKDCLPASLKIAS